LKRYKLSEPTGTEQRLLANTITSLYLRNYFIIMMIMIMMMMMIMIMMMMMMMMTIIVVVVCCCCRCWKFQR